MPTSSSPPTRDLRDEGARLHAARSLTSAEIVGLIVIATLPGNQGSYLVPALIFALVDTFVPILVGAEIGRRAAPTAKRSTATAPLKPKEA